MVDYTQHTVYLQDGVLFNFKRRLKKKKHTLYLLLDEVKDGRDKLGKRHSLSLILIILFCGIIAGNTTVKDCWLWALHNRKWLEKQIDTMPHGLAEKSTISRAIAKTDVDSLIRTFLRFRKLIFGFLPKGTASFDGKTMNGAHGKKVIKHILSLFTHETHQTLGQIGVTQKENEIPAFHRLLEQLPTVVGMLLIGDALHTQKDTIEDILIHRSDYLLFAKGNQEQLYKDLAMFFADVPFGIATDTATLYENKRKRNNTTTVTVSHDNQMCEYLGTNNWLGVKTIGKIHRVGIRTGSDGKETPVDETVYCLSSRILTAQEIAAHSRKHWKVENNLHWEKDWLFLEDRQTLRTGNAPQVMSFLRSSALSLFALFRFASPTEAVSNFEKNQMLHHQFIRVAGVV
jgi:predicted transposase YbfD/YdcC